MPALNVEEIPLTISLYQMPFEDNGRKKAYNSGKEHGVNGNMFDRQRFLHLIKEVGLMQISVVCFTF